MATKSNVPPATSRRPFQPARSHLTAETLDFSARSRILQRLIEALARNAPDPELLYLGARYAVSLARSDLALLFLDRLSETLHEGAANGEPRRPTPAFFPVGLLYLRILPPGERREQVLRALRDLAATNSRLAPFLAWIDANSAQRHVVPGSPQRMLDFVQRYFAGSLRESLATARRDERSVAQTVQASSREAKSHYESGRLGAARRALETVLLVDGDQPEALRNLITVTAEQQDREAYCRYWRRYVKLLLWRIMRNDGAAEAYEDLTQFYVRVANAADRALGPPAKPAESLVIPGLLSRWLEAHAALIWLDSARRPHRTEQAGLSSEELKAGRLGHLALMKFWCRVFYPEFSRPLTLGTARPNAPPATDTSPGRYPFRPKKPRLPFVPIDRVLLRFMEWSLVSFALKDPDAADLHTETVLALGGVVARLPIRPHLRKLREELEKKDIKPEQLHQALQQACSLCLGTALGRFLGRNDEKDPKPDWKGLIAFYGEPDIYDRLTPSLRLFLAYGYCHCDQPQRGLDIACQTLPELEPDDLQEKSQNGSLWRQIVNANIHFAMKGSAAGAKEKALGELIKRIEALPLQGKHDDFRRECLADVKNAERQLKLNDQIDKAIAESRQYAEKKEFANAKAVIRRLPDEPQEIKDLKENVLKQIEEAEQHSLLNDRIEKSIEESKLLVEKRKFNEAKNVIRRLPDSPDELKKLKANILQQIEEAERHAGLSDRIDKALEESKALVEKGKFSEAKAVVRKLPDSPDDVKKLKANLLTQIDEAELHSQLNKQVEAAIERSKKLVEEGNIREAKNVIRGLPDKPEDLKKLKANILSQIDDVERERNRAQSENGEIMNRLARKNLDLSVLGKIARDNNIDMSNPFALNALLKAIEQQAPY